MSSKLKNVYQTLRLRLDELGVITMKTSQIGINILLFASLRGDQKAKTQNSLQQYGLTSQKQLQQAQQISSSLQNHNFGTFYPEFIRAFITLYLVGLVVHLIHSQVLSIVHKKFVLQTCFGTLLMVFFHILDLMIVNDILILNSEYSNLTQAVSDIYVDSVRKQKDMIQLFEAVVRQLVNINRFLSIFFQATVLWNDGLRKLIKNKKKLVSDIPQEKLIPNGTLTNMKLKPQKKEVTHNSGKKRKPSEKVSEGRGESIEKKKRKQSELSSSVQQTKKSQKQSPKTMEQNSDPKIEESQQLFLSKQVSQVQKDDINMSTQAGSNGTKSIFEQKMKSNRSESLPNRQICKEGNQKAQRRYSQHQQVEHQRKIIRPNYDQLYKFNLQTNVDKYEIKAHSIQEMNNHLSRIQQENSWNSFLTINVKLSYWKEVYQMNQSQEIKEELQKVIAQYALYIMNQHAQNQDILE